MPPRSVQTRLDGLFKRNNKTIADHQRSSSDTKSDGVPGTLAPLSSEGKENVQQQRNGVASSAAQVPVKPFFKRRRLPGSESQSAASLPSATTRESSLDAGPPLPGVASVPTGALPSSSSAGGPPARLLLQQQQQPTAPPPSWRTKAASSGGPGAQPTQLHLDFGQRDFHGRRTCHVCGLMYTRGEPRDEKLHATFHQTASEGIRFQGWSSERVVKRDERYGRVILVNPDDPAQHQRKVKEVCELVQSALGIDPGWVLGARSARVFLYVCAQRRITGLLVANDDVRCAHRVASAPAEDCAESRPHQRQEGEEAVAGQEGTPQGRQQAADAGAQARGQRQADSEGGGGGGGGGACLTGACVPTCLQASRSCTNVTQAGSMPIAASTSAALDASSPCRPIARADSGRCNALQSACTPQRRRQQHPADSTGSASTLLQVPGAQQQRQPAAASAPPAAGTNTTATAGAAAAAPAPARIGVQRQPWPFGGSSVRMGPRVPATSAAAAAVNGGGVGPLVVDRSRLLPCQLGVRVVWVSVDTRRQGIASKLLDAARCSCLPGFVVPRGGLAFSHPTEDGRRLIQAYTGSRSFLYYES